MEDRLRQRVEELIVILLEASGMTGVKAWAMEIAFLYATARAPEANKAEVWQHIKQAYVRHVRDSFPDQEDPSQSFRRASGDAFEGFVEEYLNSSGSLMSAGIRAVRLRGEDFERLKKALGLERELRPKDVDLFLQGVDREGRPRIFGALFPKVSYAERIRADEGASRALMSKGLWSATVTLDSRNELGREARPSVKRDTINRGGFAGCYSLNRETQAGGCIHYVDVRVSGHANPLFRDIVAAWKSYQESNP